MLYRERERERERETDWRWGAVVCYSQRERDWQWGAVVCYSERERETAVVCYSKRLIGGGALRCAIQTHRDVCDVARLTMCTRSHFVFRDVDETRAGGGGGGGGGQLVCAHEQSALSFVSALGSIAVVTKCPVLRAITVPRRCKVFQTLGVGRQTLT